MIFNDHLPGEMPYINGLLKKKGVQQLCYYCYLRFGLKRTVQMLDVPDVFGLDVQSMTISDPDVASTVPRLHTGM